MEFLGNYGIFFKFCDDGSGGERDEFHFARALRDFKPKMYSRDLLSVENADFFF
jgi:hypothetical protein